MQKSAEVMGGWPVGQDEGMKGTCGRPPDFRSINDDLKHIDCFVHYLLGNCVGLTKTMQRMLVANGLRFFDDCVEYLAKEPSGRFREMHQSGNCLFLNTINEGLRGAKVSKDEFEGWKFSIRRDFWLRNCWTVPKFREKLGGIPLNQFPPSFTLADYFRHCEQRSQALQHDNLCLRQEVRQYSRKVDELMHMLKEVHKTVCPNKMDRPANEEVQTGDAPPAEGQLEYGKISDMMNGESLANALFIFTKYNMEKAFQNLGKTERNDRRSHYSKWLKCANLVKVLLDQNAEGTPKTLKTGIEVGIMRIQSKCLDEGVISQGGKLSKTILSKGGKAGTVIQKIVKDLKADEV